MSHQALKEKLAQLAKKQASEAITPRDQLAPHYADQEIQAYIHLLTDVALAYQKAASLLEKQQ